MTKRLLGLLIFLLMAGVGCNIPTEGISKPLACVTDEMRASVDEDYGDTRRVTKFTFPANNPNEAYVIRPTDHYKGPANPNFFLIEYGDFQCPGCAAFAQMNGQIIAEYPDQFGIIYRHFPLNQIHQHAHKMAEASEAAASQGRFWAYHDALYACQGQFKDLGNREAGSLMVDIAAVLGLDAEQFEQELSSGQHTTFVDALTVEAANVGLNGTPAGIVHFAGTPNAEVLPGLLVTVDPWVQLIGGELMRRGVTLE